MKLLLPLLALLAGAPAGEPLERPTPGDPAPAFSLSASNGATVTLAELKGKKSVVLAFFPKAFTGG